MLRLAFSWRQTIKVSKDNATASRPEHVRGNRMKSLFEPIR
jgi:hypothetical protein